MGISWDFSDQTFCEQNGALFRENHRNEGGIFEQTMFDDTVSGITVAAIPFHCYIFSSVTF